MSRASVKQSKATVATSAARIITQEDRVQGFGVTLLNPSGSGGTIYLGGSDVTVSGATGGFPLEPGASYEFDDKPADVFAISAGSVVVHLLRNRG